MRRIVRSAATAGVCCAAACTVMVSTPQPSPWAVNYPDTTAVHAGRIVRFAGSYGLGGPSPALVWREQSSGSVSGQMLVWYRAYAPADAGRRSAVDSTAEWKRMQASMTAERARFDSLYGCTAWVKGFQDGPAWVCRVPEAKGTVNWTRELQRVDSLVAARAKAGPAGGRRYAPDTTRAGTAPAPPRPTTTRVQPSGVAGCLDGGSWWITIRDSLGTRTITAPPSSACPRPAGVAKTYDEAGWKMLRAFIAAVK